MTRKRRRLYMVGAGMLMLAAAAALVLTAFEDSLVFSYSPTELQAKELVPERRVRLGGLVEEGSVIRGSDGVTVAFRVTDLRHSVPVTYRSEEHTSELQSLMRISYAVFCLKKKKKHTNNHSQIENPNP